MKEAGKDTGETAAPSLLRRVDDLVFATEQAILATFLSAMTVMVFLDVVYRRLVAPDSKVGRLLALITGTDSESGRATLDHTVAPILSVAVGLGALAFGFWTAERRGEAPNPRRAALRTTVAAVGLTGLGVLMVRPDFSSRAFYILLFVLIAGAFAAHLLRRRPAGFALKLGGLAASGALFIPFAWRYFPRGYTWSKEVSLMLLLWVGFLGASVCAHEGKHIRMEALGKLVPPRFAKFARAAGFGLTAAFCAFMAVLGWQYTFDPTYGAFYLGGILEQTGIPDWLAIAAVPVAFGLTAVRFVAVAVSTLRGGDYGAPISEQDEFTSAKHLELSDVEDVDLDGDSSSSEDTDCDDDASSDGAGSEEAGSNDDSSHDGGTP